MQKITAQEPEARSADIVAGNIERLRELFPEAFTEGKIDFDVLKQLLGGEVDEQPERYGLNWNGKRQARDAALTPSMGTLRPACEESVDWDTTQNLMIEGDNLEVLKLLQRSYANKVKLIYIDPPYNTGNDFVYPDNYRDGVRNYLKNTGQVDDDGVAVTSDTEKVGRRHTRWANMMFPRLLLARHLLQPEGILLVSIDENEANTLRSMLDEIFGEENFIATFIWKRKAGGGDDSGHVAIEHEYILCYSRDRDRAKLSRIAHESPAMTAKYNKSENGRRYYLERLDKTSLTYSRSMDFEIECPDGTMVSPPQPDPMNPTTAWRWSVNAVADRRDELEFHRDKKTGEWRIYTRTWESLDGVTPRSLLTDPKHGRNRDGTQDVDRLIGPKVFSNPKPVKLISHLLDIAAADEDSIVLDFFAGSGTTGHALIEKNLNDGGSRRYILVQFPEPTDRADFANICDITKRRLLRVKETIEAEAGLVAADLGFRVFKLDASNVRPWNTQPEDLQQSLFDAVDNILPGRTDDDLLYEVLLKRGLDLCVPIETREVAGRKLHSVGAGTIFACLDASIDRAAAEALAEAIIAWHKELDPTGETSVIFRDSAFDGDAAKVNLTQLLVQHGIKSVRSL